MLSKKWKIPDGGWISSTRLRPGPREPRRWGQSLGVTPHLVDLFAGDDDGGMAANQPLVGIIMGSRSDWETLRHAAEMLEQFGIPHERRVVSAHRTPELMVQYAKEAQSRGLEIIIAG